MIKQNEMRLIPLGESTALRATIHFTRREEPSIVIEELEIEGVSRLLEQILVVLAAR